MCHPRSWVDVSRPPPSQSEKDPLEILSVSSGVVSSARGPYMQTADTHSSHAMDALALDGTTHAGPSYTPLRHTATPPPFARLVNLAKPAGISEAAVWNPARYNTEQVGPSEIYIPVPLTTSVRSDPLTEQAASTILQGSGFITLSQSTGNMDDFGTGVGMPSPSQSPVSLSSPQPLHSIGGDSAILFNSQHILNYLGIPGAIQREAIARPPSREAATAAEPIYRASSAPPVDLRPSSLSRSASPERPSQPKRPSPICHTQSPSREKKSAEKLATTGKSTSSFIGGYNIRYFSFYEEPDGLKSQRKGGSAGPPAKRPWSVIEILGAVVAAGLGGYALMKFGSPMGIDVKKRRQPA
ncbi:hypothetical protein BC829DRAFT_413756 [Chytridium lagenaria]|nr:hypothetical protein BC829DRAFT_413756 [Chytridium lagenaria]